MVPFPIETAAPDCGLGPQDAKMSETLALVNVRGHTCDPHGSACRLELCSLHPGLFLGRQEPVLGEGGSLHIWEGVLQVPEAQARAGRAFCSFLSGWVVKNPPANAGDLGSLPGSRRSPGGGNGTPLQCPCLEHPTDREAWRTTVLEVAKDTS